MSWLISHLEHRQKRLSAYKDSLLLFITNINQKTSGPENAHLTPGPGIYFNAFIHVYSPREGALNPLGTNLMSTGSPYLFAHLLQVWKQTLWSMILNTF